MSDTICVLGLDAADYELAKSWNCTNLLLESATEITVRPYSLDVPATLEVWPSIATGVSPADHGVTLHPTRESDRFSLRQVLTLAANHSPNTLKKPAKRLYHRISSDGYPTTDHDSAFDNGAVYNWPGITAYHDWARELDWFRRVEDGDLSEQEFCRRSFGLAGKGVGWLISQAMCTVPIVGTHVHYLDSVGHIYANRPSQLREHYQRMDELVSKLRQQVDHLVIVSDHGMRCSALDETEIGVHSSRALLASSKDIPLPDDVLEIRHWLEELTEKTNGPETTTEIDAPREHLSDLGYL